MVQRCCEKRTEKESTTRTNKPTIIATDSLSSLLAASGNRWTRKPKTSNVRRLLDNYRNHIKLIWVLTHVGIGGIEAADQAAKDALNEEIGNQERYPPQHLIKWMKNEEFNNRQKRCENDMKHRKASVSWQNDKVKLNRKEQVVMFQDGVYQGHPQTPNWKNRDTGLPILRCTPNNDHILWQCSKTRNERDECEIKSIEGREGIKKLVKHIKKISLFRGI
jgi:hypothetical protein